MWTDQPVDRDGFGNARARPATAEAMHVPEADDHAEAIQDGEVLVREPHRPIVNAAAREEEPRRPSQIVVHQNSISNALSSGFFRGCVT
jgi:hypothetical protein